MPKRANGEGTIYQRADGRYAASIYVHAPDGSRRRVHFYGRTRQQVQQALNEKLHQEAGGLPTANTTWTVAAFFDYWLNVVAPARIRPRTRESYEGIARVHILPFIGKRPLARLTVADVQSLINMHQANGKSASVIHNIRKVLSAALNRAEREQLVMRNVARLVDIPKEERKEIKPWTVDEATTFLDATRGHRWQLGYMLLIYYGMRRGEALGLRWSDVDFAHDRFKINQQLQRIGGVLETGPVKTSAGQRWLPLLGVIKAVILEIASQHGIDPMNPPAGAWEEQLILLSSAGTPVDPHNFTRDFHIIREGAGLRRITVHHTRHTAATMLKRLGVQPRDAQAILGHASVITTQSIYQHADPELHREALERIEATLAGSELERAGLMPEVISDSNALLSPLLSKSSHDIEVASVKPTKNADSTGVESAQFIGGPDGDRTHDTLLKRALSHTSELIPTPVVARLAQRTIALLVGHVAVRVAVKTSRNEQRIEALLATAKHLRDTQQARQARRLRELSFPLNLLPSTPLMPPEEAH